MQRIIPCLWFDTQAEEAARFYTSIFPNSRIIALSRFTEAGHEVHGQPAGLVMTVQFVLNGQEYTALNGGPQFKFNEAVSLQVVCDTQEEVDYYWSKLSAGGDETAQQCGWLKDQFGVSWQVSPSALPALIGDLDVRKSGRVMKAMLKMKKLDLAALQRAHDQQ